MITGVNNLRNIDLRNEMNMNLAVSLKILLIFALAGCVCMMFKGRLSQYESHTNSVRQPHTNSVRQPHTSYR